MKEVKKYYIPCSALCPNRTLFSMNPQEFGCVCHVRDHRLGLSKLDPHSLRCIFLGYPRSQKGYMCYHPLSHRMFSCTDVSFMEFTPYNSAIVSSTSDSSPIQVSSPPASSPIHMVTTVTASPSIPIIPPLKVYSKCLPLPTPSNDDRPAKGVPPSARTISLPTEFDLDLSVALRKGTHTCT